MAGWKDLRNGATGSGTATQCYSHRRFVCCREWQSMLADVLDGELDTIDLEVFENHRRFCAECRDLFVLASRGRNWLALLRESSRVLLSHEKGVLQRRERP